MRDKPLFLKCCRCVPLTFWLQIWAWFKLVADILISLFTVAIPLRYWLTNNSDTRYPLSTLEALFLGILFFSIVDTVFILSLIVGVFWKKYAVLRIFFYYGIYMILYEAAVIFIITFLSVYKTSIRTWNSLILFLLLGFSWMAIDICIMLTLKSEMIKLRNKEQRNFNEEQASNT